MEFKNFNIHTIEIEPKCSVDIRDTMKEMKKLARKANAVVCCNSFNGIKFFIGLNSNVEGKLIEYHRRYCDMYGEYKYISSKTNES